MRTFLKQLFCFHGKKQCWKIVNISYDGGVLLECQRCGKLKEKHI